MKHFIKEVVVKLLTFEAKIVLRRTKPKIIAITGSVGKTSTKDAIFIALKEKYSVRKSEKSFNTEIGVPLTVLGLSNAWSSPVGWLKNLIEGAALAIYPANYPEILVLEMGVDHPGDMQKHCEWIKPDTVVLTRLPDLPVHVEFFDSPEAVIAEKLILVSALKDNGVLVYNSDDEKVSKVASEQRQKSIGYSRYSKSDFRITGDKVLYDGDKLKGISFDIANSSNLATFEVKDTLGIQHAYSIAAAAAVAEEYDVSLKEVATLMQGYHPPAARMRLVEGIKNTLIIDDTYNSSPTALERALLTLGEIETNGRKIAVLGDMLELGQYATKAHEEVGELVAKNADFLVTIGVRARKIAEGALENGMSEKNILQYDSVDKAANEVQNILEEGDIVLVKASQSIRAEKFVEEIMAEPERAEELLTRQSPEWKNK